MGEGVLMSRSIFVSCNKRYLAHNCHDNSQGGEWDVARES